MVKYSDIKNIKPVRFNGYKSQDNNYYVNGKKIYCIRFYFESHIMYKRYKIKLHRLDFTLPWYTGE